MSYQVRIFYDANHYPAMDLVIHKIIKRKYNDASGMGFGERDVAFDFKSRASALKAFDKLSKVKRIGRLTLERSFD